MGGWCGEREEAGGRGGRGRSTEEAVGSLVPLSRASAGHLPLAVESGQGVDVRANSSSRDIVVLRSWLGCSLGGRCWRFLRRRFPVSLSSLLTPGPSSGLWLRPDLPLMFTPPPLNISIFTRWLLDTPSSLLLPSGLLQHPGLGRLDQADLLVTQTPPQPHLSQKMG